MNFNNQDSIKISVLQDGTIRVETGKISGASHLNAEQFLREMSKLAGGTTEVKQKNATLGQQQDQQKHLNQ